jgi:hypothetical protein
MDSELLKQCETVFEFLNDMPHAFTLAIENLTHVKNETTEEQLVLIENNLNRYYEIAKKYHVLLHKHKEFENKFITIIRNFEKASTALNYELATIRFKGF